MNELFSLEFTLDDPGAESVSIDADMPSHGHGMLVQQQLVALGVQTYRADGMLFHMPGDWVVTITYLSNGETQSFDAPIAMDF